jgi:hypothetical protein
MYSILITQSSNILRNTRVLISLNFGVVVLSWNDHITFVMSARLSFRLYICSGRISVKFDNGHCYENLSIISTHVSNLIKISGTLHYNLRILLRYYYCRRWLKFAIENFYAFLDRSQNFENRLLFSCSCVRPSAWKNSTLTRWIFMKFDTWIFIKNISRKFKSHYYLSRKTTSLHEGLCTFMTVSAWILVARNIKNRSSVESNYIVNIQ